MKSINLLILILVGIFASGQPSNYTPRNTGHIVVNRTGSNTAAPEMQTLFIPPYANVDSSARFITPNQKFTTVITNNSSHPVSLYPYLNRQNMSQIAWGDSFLLAYLYSQIEGMTDTDAIRLKLVQVVGSKLEKSDLFCHGEVLYDAYPDVNLYTKQNSLMGALIGAYHKQCGNYVSSAIQILIKTGFFNATNIKVVGLIGHITATFLYRGGWCFVDFDPAEPFFMISNPANANGFASPMDIYNNHNLITDDQRYRFVNDSGDSITMYKPTMTTQYYQNRFNSVTISDIPYTDAPVTLSGIITLPAKASIIAEFGGVYVLDSASSLAVRSCSSDSIYLKLSQILGVGMDSITTLVSENKIQFNYTKNWQPNYQGVTPVLKFVLPATNDTLKIGANKGVSFAGYVLGSNTGLSLSDSIFAAGEFPKLWKPSDNGSLSVSDGMVNYLSSDGFIPPHQNSNDTITVSYNPMVINFSTGFKLGYIGDSIFAQTFYNDSLVASDSTYKQGGRSIINSISLRRVNDMPQSTDSLVREHRHSRANGDLADSISGDQTISNDVAISIFPNPSTVNFHITVGNSAPDYTLLMYDMNGRIVRKQPIFESNEVISTDGLSGGTYLCVIVNSAQLPIYSTKLIIM